MFFEAILREVKSGAEQQYQQDLAQFFEQSKALFPDSDAYVISPVSEQDRTVGLIRSFKNKAARDQFYESEHFKAWDKKVAELTLGSARRRPVHGLEAFFVDPKPPARWKMILLTWLAVCISVAFFSHTMVPHMKQVMPGFLVFLTANMLVVLTLALLLMPLFTKVLHGWLHPE